MDLANTGYSQHLSLIIAMPVKLLNWGVGTKMSTDEISVAVIEWMAPKGNDELVAFSGNEDSKGVTFG